MSISKNVRDYVPSIAFIVIAASFLLGFPLLGVALSLSWAAVTGVCAMLDLVSTVADGIVGCFQSLFEASETQPEVYEQASDRDIQQIIERSCYANSNGDANVSSMRHDAPPKTMQEAYYQRIGFFISQPAVASAPALQAHVPVAVPVGGQCMAK